MTAEPQKENSRFLVASTEARAMLAEAGTRLRAILQDKAIVGGTPIEATTAMELAIETIDTAVAKLKAGTPVGKRLLVAPGGPTRQQGQFLAFIRST